MFEPPLPDELRQLAELGWRLYPASRSSRAAMFPGATDAATADLSTLAIWNHRYGPCNWRVVMDGSGIWALDIDVPGGGHVADGFAVMQRLVAKHGGLPDCPRTRSGGGGVALIFRDTGAPICKRTGYPEPGVDPRAGRLSITVPPSIHLRTRWPYRWIRAPWECPPPVAPDWLLHAVRPPPERPVMPVTAPTAEGGARRAYNFALEKLRQAGAGARNTCLNRSSFALGRWVGAGLLSEADCAGALYVVARQIGLEHHEARATITSGLRAGAQRPVEIIHA